MTAKRFEFREINEPPMVPKVYDTEKQEYANLFECVGWLNELNDTNKKFGEERWAIMELIIEYDTTDKYSEKDVIDKIKDILGLVMIE